MTTPTAAAAPLAARGADAAAGGAGDVRHQQAGAAAVWGSSQLEAGLPAAAAAARARLCSPALLPPFPAGLPVPPTAAQHAACRACRRRPTARSGCRRPSAAPCATTGASVRAGAAVGPWLALHRGTAGWVAQVALAQPGVPRCVVVCVSEDGAHLAVLCGGSPCPRSSRCGTPCSPCCGAGKWVYHRDGHDLHTRLRHELKQLTGQDLDLSPCFACGKLNTCQVGAATGAAAAAALAGARVHCGACCALAAKPGFLAPPNLSPHGPYPACRVSSAPMGSIRASHGRATRRGAAGGALTQHGGGACCSSSYLPDGLCLFD